ERVPQYRVAAARHVDREIRLEHAGVGAELLDGELVVVPRGLAELLASRWARALVPAEAVDLHVDPAELGDDVGTGGELRDGFAPLRVDILGVAGVWADTQRAAEVIEDDRGAGKRAGQRGDVRDLVVVEPRLERELARRQMLEPNAEVVAQQQTLPGLGTVTRHGVVRVPGRAQPDATEPAAAGSDLRVEHGGHPVAEAQVGRADDPGGDPRLAVEPRRAHRRDPVHELGLAD